MDLQCDYAKEGSNMNMINGYQAYRNDFYDNSVANALAWYFKEQGKPFILETPNEDDGYQKEIAFVKENMINA